MALRRSVLSGICALLWVGLASGASATTNYGDFFGDSIDFLDVNETSTTDPEPLFDAPIVVGNALLFFPNAFRSEATNGSTDTTSSLLNATIMASTPLATIDEFNITEFGDWNLAGVGTDATGTFVNLSGFLTVLEVLGAPVLPQVIPFSASYSPSQLGLLGTDGPGTTLWSATVNVDVASIVPGVTKLELQLDNDLITSSEAGTTATIQKKVVNGPSIVIEIIPEPTTGLLLAGGLLGLAMRRRGRARNG